MAFKTYKTYKQIPKETKQFFMDKEGVKDIKKVPLSYINSIMEEWEAPLTSDELVYFSDEEIEELMQLNDDELDELEY
tara:strand:- start:360 stop:593 length:234 start_codon:yes stop_codon:yes gene_type:complete